LNFRDSFRYLTPAWLSSGEGERLLHTISILFDAYLERVYQGLNARFPTRTGESHVNLIGRDRAIPRGRIEPVGHYARRLRAWRWPRGHRTRGTAFALLEQVVEYFGGLASAWTVDASGNRFNRSASGVESYYGYAWPWYSDAVWARFWVVVEGSDIFTPHTEPDDPNLWYGYESVDICVGQYGFYPTDDLLFQELMHGPNPWRPAGVIPEWLVLNTIVWPTSPTTSWEHWSLNIDGVQEPSRAHWLRFISLSNNNTYVGQSDNYPSALRMPEGDAYFGTNTYHSTITLQDGTEYAGTPGAFSGITLLDDGDIV